MKFSTDAAGRDTEIIALFQRTFSAAEGAAEGQVIANLVRDLLGTKPADDLYVFLAFDDAALIGAIIFSRLCFEGDGRSVFILSPVAVDPARQRSGVGQQLIRHGLDELRAQGVEVAFTYGDPAYYGKVGFQPIAEHAARAPLPLNHPHGWLAQSLDGRELAPFMGPSRCVTALAKPEIW